MKIPKFVALLALTLPAAAVRSESPANSLTPAEIEAGWLLLFDGQTTFGWQPTSDAIGRSATAHCEPIEGSPVS